MKLSILYRGALSSCNYNCAYCPFEKHAETVQSREQDSRALARFVDWAAGRHNDRLSILFTPWGEALIHPRYQRALIRLSNMPNVEQVAIQTNLSCRLDWLEAGHKTRLALWTTFHPPQISLTRFLAKCRWLDARDIRFSVGVVGLIEHLDAIEALRRELPPHIYLWVNAYKHLPDYYTDDHRRRLTAVDPLFRFNNQRYPSHGAACRCGHSVISVDGDGTVCRCHFIQTPIANIYAPDFEQALKPSPCTNLTCGCHIGYVHMEKLGLYDIFQEGVLARIPQRYAEMTGKADNLT